jgi:hypothetical protein
MEIEVLFEEEASGRCRDGVFEVSVLFGRDILEALRILVAEWLLPGVRLDESARGALSARVLCVVGISGDGHEEISESGTVTEIKVSTRRDWTTFSNVLCE